MEDLIRVLVVDDSAFMRKIIAEVLTSDTDIEVVGVARDGRDAINKIRSLKPDVITLDVEMPGLDGLDVLKWVMKEQPTPVLMVSSLTTEGAAVTVDALLNGAVDFIAKPGGSISLGFRAVGEELLEKVHYCSRLKGSDLARRLKGSSRVNRELDAALRRRRQSVALPDQPKDRQPSLQTELSSRGPSHSRCCVVIGSSTGGPGALTSVVPALPARLPASVLIVQHMPPGFTATLAQRLDQNSPISVREAKDGDLLEDGRVLVAPGGRHMTIKHGGVVALLDTPPVHGVRPAIDITLESVAPVYGRRCLAVILTGMGSDGTQGAKYVKRLGGKTIAQDEETCVVFGMPKSLVTAGAADKVLPISAIGKAIYDFVSNI